MAILDKASIQAMRFQICQAALISGLSLRTISHRYMVYCWMSYELGRSKSDMFGGDQIDFFIGSGDKSALGEMVGPPEPRWIAVIAGSEKSWCVRPVTRAMAPNRTAN
jgi:hypothetical protein